MTDVYEQDLKHSTAYDFARWQHRPVLEKLAEVVLIPIRSQL
jgi:cardiolipin synthase